MESNVTEGSPEVSVPRVGIGRWLYWPCMMLVGVAFLAWADQIGLRNEARLAIALALFAIVLATEPSFSLRSDHAVKGDTDHGHDLGHFGLSMLSEGVCVAILVPLAMLAAPSTVALLGGGIWPSVLPYAMQCLLSVFVADGLNYLSHRWVHGPALWPMHAVHHDIPRLNVMKGGRVHGLNVLFRGLTVYVPLILIGMPPEMLFWYGCAIVLVQTIGHGNVDLAVPEFVHRWLVTPAVHRLHHANVGPERECNFAGVFTVWDRLFGTYEHPSGVPPEVGIPGTEHQPADFWGQVLYPFWRWSAMLRGRS